MKELSIEEKAKRFDEAIEKLRNFYRDYDTVSCLIDVKEELANLFPELKESEDERIRKWCISHFKECINVIKDNDEYKEYLSNKVIAWLKKQGEQKSAWSEKYIADVFEKVGLAKIVREQSNDSLTNALQDAMIELSKFLPQPKQEWSEEDESRIDNLCHFLEEYGNQYYGYLTLQCTISWLKSLRPQNGYNPYKEIVESIAEMCKHYDKASHSGLRDFYDNVKVKCKDAKEYDSLYPQSTWKPSDEQINALNDINLNGGLRYAGQGQVLIDLYNDLKKLRQE